jgi:putative sterol carrier protein
LKALIVVFSKIELGVKRLTKFPSEEWIQEFAKILNESKSYEEAARTWEGDFLFILTPDDGLEKEYVFYLDLWHGKCRGAKLLETRDEKMAQYAYEGPYSNWKKLIQGEIDPIRGLLTRKFKLRGSMINVMRASRAASELVSTAKKVQTEFV